MSAKLSSLFGVSAIILIVGSILVGIIAVENEPGSVRFTGVKLGHDELATPVRLPKILDYGSFVAKHNKNYSPIETVNKAKLFYGRTLKIFQHNMLYKTKNVGYYLKQNEFIDKLPSELKKSKTDDLQPVAGADFYPNLPADKLYDMMTNRAGKDTDTKASLDDISYGSSSGVDIFDSGKDKIVEQKASRAGPILNVLVDQSIDDIHGMIQTLKHEPELAEKLASLVEIEGNNPDPLASLTKEQRQLLKQSNKITYNPRVPSNNQNYDFWSIPSYGAEESTEQKPKQKHNYADYLIHGANFDFDIDSDEGLDGPETPRQRMSLSNLFGSLRNVFDSLVDSDDESDDEDEFQEAQENLYIEPIKKPVPKKKRETKYEIDWRTSGCISAPKSQMECDSCYAFTVMSLMEYFYCKEKQTLTDFSAQYVVDCGSRAELNGCRGGKISNVGKFIREYGIELNSMYPYKGTEGQCERGEGYLKLKITAWKRFSEITAWYKWLPRSPLIVGINMPSDFYSYGGGVHDGFDCVGDMVHAMLLVGSGVEDGKKFWLLKNSFSEKWGEAGYFRLAHSAPLRCFDSSFVVKVQFGDGTKDSKTTK